MLARVGCALVILTSTMCLAAVPTVNITSPSKDQPAFGSQVISATVESSETIIKVTFYVDGRRLGEVLAPPYQFTADIGQGNVEHSFKVIAHTSSGAVGSGEITTPKVRVDEAVSFDLQQLYVTVTKNGQRVHDLSREDFEIFDNGDKQKSITFERGSVPFTAMILLDASRSMVGKKIQAALNGAQSFAAGMQPLDEAKLMVFSANLLVSTTFMGPGDGLTKGLGTIIAEGGTSLNDHLYVALKQLEERQGRRVVIVLSDGMDSHSVLSIDDAYPTVERSRALIYWVRIEDGEKDACPRARHAVFCLAGWQGLPAPNRAYGSQRSGQWWTDHADRFPRGGGVGVQRDPRGIARPVCLRLLPQQREAQWALARCRGSHAP